MSVVRPVRLIGTLTFLTLSITVAAHAEELRPETVWIPMTDHDSAGAAYTWRRRCIDHRNASRSRSSCSTTVQQVACGDCRPRHSDTRQSRSSSSSEGSPS